MDSRGDEAPRAGGPDRRIDTRASSTPAEVSRIASSIDVPVYIWRWCRRLTTRGAQEGGNRALDGDLADLARWTGGQLFIATSTPEASTVGARASSASCGSST